MLLSIIIPVYNAASYLPACLESILSQQLPLHEYEVIAIDDGSVDSSPSVLEEYRSRIPNLQVVRQANSGQSVARNAGLRLAQGKYIFFVDADDTLIPGGLRRLFDSLPARTEEVIGFDYVAVREDGSHHPWHHQVFIRNRSFTGSEFLAGNQVIGVLWGYLFSNDLIRRHRLHMIPGIYHEDEEFVTRAFFHARSVIVLDIPVYCYYRRENSTVTRSDMAHRVRLINDRITVLQALSDLSGNSSESAAVLLRKRTFLSIDIIRLLIREGHQESFIRSVLERLSGMRLYPLPAAPYGAKYALFRRLIASPARIVRLARMPAYYFPVKKII